MSKPKRTQLSATLTPAAGYRAQVVSVEGRTAGFALEPGRVYVLARDRASALGSEHAAVAQILPVGFGRPEISGCHALIRIEGAELLVRDLSSTNGTFASDGSTRIEGETRLPLPTTIHLAQEIVSITVTRASVPGQAPTRMARVTLADLDSGAALTIGRGEDCDLILDHPSISRRHCSIQRTEAAFLLIDHDSLNGTFLEDVPIRGRTLLPEQATIRIGPFALTLAGDELAAEALAGLPLVARNLTCTVYDPKTGPRDILRNVNLRLRAGEFVAIIGKSGSGKTTLLSRLAGVTGGGERGCVTIGDYAIPEDLPRLRQLVGFVPQRETIHARLTVRQALDHTIALRSPDALAPAERLASIQAVLRQLGLTEKLDTCIESLSGGERRRISLAAELLAEPKILFLDEITSGLDASTERELMRILRDLARRGTTIVCITHHVDNVHLCDRVAVLTGASLTSRDVPTGALPTSRDREGAVDPTTRDDLTTRAKTSRDREGAVAPTTRDDPTTRDVPTSRDREGAVDPTTRDDSTSRDNPTTRDVPTSRDREGAVDPTTRDDSTSRDSPTTAQTSRPPAADEGAVPPNSAKQPPAGALAFFGTPEACLAHYGASDFAAVLDSPPAHGAIPSQQAPLADPPGDHTDPAADAPRVTAAAHVPHLRQFRVVLMRQLQLLSADRKALLLLVGQPILVGLILLIAFSHLDPLYYGPGADVWKIAFLLAVATVWLATANAAREIVSERRVLQQERRAGLRISSYLSAKMCALTAIGTLQAIVLLAFVRFLPADGSAGFLAPFRGMVPLPEALLLLIAALFAGSASGLLLSALAGSARQAAALVPYLLLPQVILGGALVPTVPDGSIGGILRTTLGLLMPVNWTYAGLRVGETELPASAWAGDGSIAHAGGDPAVVAAIHEHGMKWYGDGRSFADAAFWLPVLALLLWGSIAIALTGVVAARRRWSGR